MGGETRQRVEFEGAPTRCPYCHADVDPTRRGWIACVACLARHHLACWGEHGRCASCGGTEKLERSREARPVPRARPAAAAVAGTLGLLAVAALAAVVASSTGPRGVRPAQPREMAPTLPISQVPRIDAPATLAAPPPAPAMVAKAAARPGTIPSWCSAFRESAHTKLAGVYGATELPLGIAYEGVAVSGAKLLGAIGESPLAIWDFEASELRRIGAQNEPISSIAFSPDGATVLVAGRNFGLDLLDATTGAKIRSFETQGVRADCVAFSPDGKHALSGASNGALTVWDLSTSRSVRSFVAHEDWILQTACISGTRGVSAGADKIVKLWDLEAPAALATFPCKARTISLAVSSDGRRALVGAKYETRLLDLTGKAWAHVLIGHARSEDVEAVAFSRDGRLALTAAWAKINIWNVEREEIVDSIRFYSGATGIGRIAAAFSADGRSFVVGGGRGVFFRFELKDL